MNLRPICLPCGLEMDIIKNDYPVKDLAVGNCPASVWLGDKFECRSCDAAIVTGFGRSRPSHNVPNELVAEAAEFQR